MTFHLHWETISEVEEAGLTDVLHLSARLTHLGLLETGLRAWIPSEDGEGPGADLALLSIPLSDHPEVRILPEAVG